MKNSWAKWLLIWACWTFAALFLTSEVILRGGSVYQIGNWELFLRELITQYLWFGLTPLVIRLVRVIPIEKENWKRNLVYHICLSIFVGVVHVVVYTFIVQITNLTIGSGTYWQRLQNLLTFNFHSNIVCYWIIFGITYTIDSYRRQHEKDLKTSQIETRLAQVQLQSLKSQLHPHFLFNTLNTISVLMERDAKSANQMLVNLGDLLRIALDDAGTPEVPLKQELDFLERYLKIEQMRFEERLTVKMNIEPETLDANVPNLILQPLVENAVHHGIAPNISGGTIEITARREAEMLHLFVRDNGGLENNGKNLQKGIGLSNTETRLKQMFNENHTFQINRKDGFSVSISIPFRTNGSSIFEK